METLAQSLAEIAGSRWELLAVVLAIAYLLLAMAENSWCWLCAFVSTVIYTVIFWNVNLLMDSALNVYYMLMAVYGWHQWNYGGDRQRHAALSIRRWSLQNHLLAALGITALTLFSGYLLDRNTQAAWPYLDSFTTWASVLTTYMVAKKVLENWLYWIVIDSVACFLYIDRMLYATALLFAAYVVIVIIGYIHWRQLYRANLDYQHA